MNSNWKDNILFSFETSNIWLIKKYYFWPGSVYTINIVYVKKYLLSILFLLAVFSLFAQMPKVKNDPNHDDKPIHFGFSLGFNFMDYSVYQSEMAKEGSYYAGIKSLSPGINIQAIANLRLANHWDLRSLPGISFGERTGEQIILQLCIRHRILLSFWKNNTSSFGEC